VASISGGKIYYTVHVDPATLNAAITALKALGAAAKVVNQNFKNGNVELSKWEFAAKQLSAAIETVNSDYKSGAIDISKYLQEMSRLEGEANTLRTQFAAVSSSITSTASDMQRAQDITASLAGSMSNTANVTGGTKAAMEKLGVEFKTAEAEISRLNSEVRNNTKAFKATQMSAQEFMSRLAPLRVQLEAMKGVVRGYADAGTYAAAETRRLGLAAAAAQNGLTQIAQGAVAATGQLNRMATTAALGRGAIALLNDQIFKVSPTLGIFINHLSYATVGMRAFLAAAGPIIAIVGSFVVVAKVMSSAARAGIELQSALIDVAKTTNLTQPELRKITGTFQELAKDIPVTTLEFLEFARVAGQLGITGVRNIELFAEAIGKLSVATDVIGEEGATSLARFLQATGVATENLGGFALQVGNVLNELENTSAATAGEILKMTSYTQGLASQAGASQAQILGLNAALLSLGVQAEAGGSAIVRTIGKIQLAVSGNERAFSRFAAAAQMTNDEYRKLAENNPIAALTALARGLNQAAASGASLNNVLSELGIREVRERRTLLALAQGADTLEASLKTANDESLRMLSLNREVATMSSTVASRWTTLGSRLKTVAQDLGNVLMPALEGSVELLINVTDATVQLFRSLGDLWTRLMQFLRLHDENKSSIRENSLAWRENRNALDNVLVALTALSQFSGVEPTSLITVMSDYLATLDEAGRRVFTTFMDLDSMAGVSLRELIESGDLVEATRQLGLYFLEAGLAAAVATRDSSEAVRDAASAGLASFQAASSVSNAGLETARRNLELYQMLLAAINIEFDEQNYTFGPSFGLMSEEAAEILETLRATSREFAAMLDEVASADGSLSRNLDPGRDLLQRLIDNIGQVPAEGSALFNNMVELVALLDDNIDITSASIVDMSAALRELEGSDEFIRLSDLFEDANKNINLAEDNLLKFTEGLQTFPQLTTFEQYLDFFKQFASIDLNFRFSIGEDGDDNVVDALNKLNDKLLEDLEASQERFVRESSALMAREFPTIQLAVELQSDPDALRNFLAPFTEERLRTELGLYESATQEVNRMIFRLKQENLDIPTELNEAYFEYADKWAQLFNDIYEFDLISAINPAARAADMAKAAQGVIDALNASLKRIYDEGMLGLLDDSGGVEVLQSNILERRADAYKTAITGLLSAGFGIDNEVVMNLASRYRELTGAVFDFAKAQEEAKEEVKKLEEVDRIYANHQQRLMELARTSAWYGMSENERLVALRDIFSETEEALVLLGQAEMPRFLALVDQFEDIKNSIDVISPALELLSDNLNLARAQAEVLSRATGFGLVEEVALANTELALMRSTILSLVEDGARLDDVRFINLLNEWSELSRVVGVAEDEIAAFLEQQELEAVRVARIEAAYISYAEERSRIDWEAQRHSWSEQRRLEAIRDLIFDTERALNGLGATNTARYFAFLRDLDAVDAALAATDLAAPILSKLEQDLAQSRDIVLFRAGVRDGDVIPLEVKVEVDTAALQLMDVAINDIIATGRGLSDIRLAGLVSEFNTLAESVGMNEAAIQAWAAEREALAERVAYDQKLAQLEVYFTNLRTVANLSYVDSLAILAAQNIELDAKQLALLRSTYELSTQQAVAAETVRDYERSVNVLSTQLRLGLITEQQMLNQQLGAAEEKLLNVALVMQNDLSPEVIAAQAEVARLRAALSEVAYSADTLAARFQLGLISRTEFLRGQLALVVSQLADLDAALEVAILKFDLASEEVRELVELIKRLRAEQDRLNKALKAPDLSGVVSATGSYGSEFAKVVGLVADAFQDYADKNANIGDVIGAIGIAFNSLAGDLEGAEGRFVQSLTGMVGAIVELTLPGFGKAIAAIGSFIATIIDFSGSVKRARADVKNSFESVRLMSDETIKSFTGLKGATKQVRRDGFLGWLGFKKTVMDEDFIDDVKSIFGDIAGVLSGALSDALDASLEGEDWESAFKKNFNDSVLRLIKNTFIEATLLAAGFQTVLAEFTRIMKEEGIANAIEFLKGQLPDIFKGAEEALAEFGKSIPELFPLDDLWEATDKNLKRIKDNILAGSRMLTDGLVDTLIRLATIDGLVNEASLNALVSLAETISGGFEQGLRSGINAFLSGDQDWKDSLREGIKGTIVSSLIDAFIAGSAVQVIAADFVAGFIEALEGGQANASAWAKDNISLAVSEMSALIEAFVSSIPPELLPSSNPRSRDYRPPDEPERAPEPRAAGTRISEITGPTRDLLVDLLTPLSILPSWTSMIRDIRNDLRSLVTGGGMIGSLALGVASSSGVATVQSQSITIQNLTVTTQAKDARELYRELSTFAFKERKGGK
jgi:TP901 family phage tail tape measure protein